jgi:CBS domain-containing membrane protein
MHSLGLVKVRQIMTTPVEALVPTDDLEYARERMALGRVRHLPVVDGEVLVGLITMSDLLSAVHSGVRSDMTSDDDDAILRKTEVAGFMRGSVETVSPDTDAIVAADTLLTQKIGCLPVIDERQRLVGIVTDSDFVRLARELIARQDTRAPRVKKAG